MKRSEFKKWLDGGLRYGFPGEDKKETIIAKMEEAAGPIQWEPEQEPAPRLSLHAGAVIEETESYRHIVAAPREAPGRTERNAKILADMFEAYNRGREQAQVEKKLLERYREIVRKAIADLEGVLADLRGE